MPNIPPPTATASPPESVHPPVQPSPWREPLWLALGLVVLLALAQALAQAPLGLDLRYQAGAAAGSQWLNQRAVWLANHAALALAVLAFAGYLSLRLARATLPLGAAIAAWCAIWLGAYAGFYPGRNLVLPNGALQPWSDAAVLASLALLALPIAARLTRLHWLPRQQVVHSLAYPGFVLFTGLGALWLLDYAARGRPVWQHLGVEHFDHLFLAYAGLGLAARFAPAIMAPCARAWARLDRASQWGNPYWLTASKLLPWVIGAAAIATIALNTNPRFPSKGAELIRLIACVLGAWVVYRWTPFSHHGARIAAGLGAMAGFTLLGLLRVHEFGQLLVLSWGAAILLGGAVAWALFNRPTHQPKRRTWARLAALAVGIGIASSLIWASQALLHEVAAWLPKHIRARLTAIDPASPFAGELEYVSELRWFLHDLPLGGYGLGQVPWCGSIGQFGLQHAVCRGVPRETHADYVLAGLAGSYGVVGAWLIAGALAAWCFSLLRLPATTRLAALDAGHLTQMLGLCFMVLTTTQLLITCLGTVAAIPMTGVNFPLLGDGGTSLLLCSVVMGALMHCTRAHPTHA